jgi:hypothetical protein
MLSVVFILVSTVQLPDGLVLPIIEITWAFLVSEKSAIKRSSNFVFILILVV